MDYFLTSFSEQMTLFAEPSFALGELITLAFDKSIELDIAQAVWILFVWCFQAIYISGAMICITDEVSYYLEAGDEQIEAPYSLSTLILTLTMIALITFNPFCATMATMCILIYHFTYCSRCLPVYHKLCFEGLMVFLYWFVGWTTMFACMKSYGADVMFKTGAPLYGPIVVRRLCDDMYIAPFA